jgi:TetR/AcrR family transcriptional regulator, fatty acid metabolism regulator protein
MNKEITDTRSKILEAAALVFAEKGYHEARVDDIATQSNTSKGSVYFYFPSKQEIFLGLIDTFADLLENRLFDAIRFENHGLQQLDSALHVSLKLFTQYRTLAKIVFIQAVGIGSEFELRRRAINDRFTSIIKKRLDQAILDGSIEEIDTDLVARAWVGVLNEMVIHWIFTNNKDLMADLPDIRKFLLRSIGIQDK